jgi:hypothetical protein
MWTLLIEMIPCFIAAPLVTCMSGLQEAMNRELLQGIPLDPIYGAFVPWTLVVIYIWARDELPDDAIYEVAALKSRVLCTGVIDALVESHQSRAVGR